MNRFIVVSLALASGANAAVVWDYGQDAAFAGGGFNSGCWQSQSGAQNFTENVVFGSNTNITGMTYDSCFPGLNGLNFHIKVDQDTNGDGIPDSSVTAFDANAISETDIGNFNGSEIYRYEFSFGTITQPGGANYCWGVSGNGFEGAQTSHLNSNLPLFSNTMHQYSGNSYSSEAGVGDQAFQLLGGVPAPGTAGLLGLAGLVAGRRRR